MSLRNVLLATAVLAIVPSPAVARDRTPYIGIEGGVIKPEKLKFDYQRGAFSINNGLVLEPKSGFDVDLVTGYDFGLVRAEGELGWKRAGLEDIAAPTAVLPATGRPAVSGSTKVLSAMANLLLDFGSDDGLQIYGGGGLGIARLSLDADIFGPGVPPGRLISGDDNSLAWQAIAGMRVPVNYNVDLGLKYRYFRAKADFEEAGAAGERLDGRFKSHSILASVIINLGSPPAPPPPPPAPPPVIAPPPPPPATQTCPDGSVILASDVCPVPPPPPPPPPPEPVRG